MQYADGNQSYHLVLVSLLFVISYKWLHHWLICLYVASFESGCQLVAFMGKNIEDRYFTSHLHGKYGLPRYTAREFRFRSMIHNSNITNDVAAFFLFNLTGGGTDVCVFVNPSHDLQNIWQCLCPSISWPADTFGNICVHPSYDLQTHLAMSTFSPIGMWSSNAMRMCVCVCVCVDRMNLTFTLRWHIHVSVHSVLYTSTCTHASSTHLRTGNRRG